MQVFYIILLLFPIIILLWVEFKRTSKPLQDLKPGETYCENCHGSGWSMAHAGDEKCPICRGTGTKSK